MCQFDRLTFSMPKVINDVKIPNYSTIKNNTLIFEDDFKSKQRR